MTCRQDGNVDTIQAHMLLMIGRRITFNFGRLTFLQCITIAPIPASGRGVKGRTAGGAAAGVSVFGAPAAPAALATLAALVAARAERLAGAAAAGASAAAGTGC